MWKLLKNMNTTFTRLLLICFCYLLLQCTVEDEDEHALEGIEGSEQVGHNHCVVINKEETKGPC